MFKLISTVILFLIPVLSFSQKAVGTTKIISKKTEVKAKPKINAPTLKVIEKGEIVTVLNRSVEKYVLVSLGADTGYVETFCLKDQRLVNQAKYGENDPLLKELKTRFNSKTANRIYNEKVWKGMTEEMLRLSWGNPQNIRRSRKNSIVSEKWIYSKENEIRYIKLENGVVTSLKS